ncbi:SH3 domain-binding glutamic acid-rich-like protein 3 [Biomphalaria glabrata]|uniref:SH3 domain-binding glutamic acid-rich-like protein 3 n=2 Tax=Biomphalaria TaxID=6525 RepID=A0A9W2YM93_BIOGL|nr:SH3 domain-binding glutamic acid-rich-like protein 3 [Biomphalaria glabrata]
MSSKIKVYISNLASNMETKKQQMRIQDVLSGAKIDFEVIDVSASKDDLAKMREIVGNSKALAPQIANGDTYCGDYDAFDNAVECKTLHDFLKI